MMLGRMDENLDARILVMILKQIFNRLIGLKSLKVEGFPHLGMRAIRKEAEALRSLTERKKKNSGLQLQRNCPQCPNSGEETTRESIWTWGTEIAKREDNIFHLLQSRNG